MKDAEIVAIGTEILLGDLLDTNTPWLSRKLAALGVAVRRHTTVGDDKERIVATFLEAALRADLVITVGGLGATPDDLTHECLREATSREMVEYSEARRHLDEVFERFAGRKPPPSAYEQALFPEGSKLIPNPLGTAMGAMLEANGTLFATFPGVPTEMERMFEETLEPLIRRRSEGIIVSQTLRFAGISEEEMADIVRDLLGVADPSVAPLVGPGEVGVGEVDLRVTTRAITREEAEKKMEPVVQEIISRLSGYYRGWQPQEGDTMRDEGIRTSETDPIQADFLPEDEVQTPGRLGMTFAPGMRTTGMRGQWERDLTADLGALEEEHETDVLVSLMEDHEYHGYRISELLERDRIGSIKILRFAIKDMGVPHEAESEKFEAFVQDVVERLEQGQNVVVHCRGGLGRTGTLAACVLVALGRHSADEAIAAVRAARKGTVQTREQEDFVRLFDETVRARGNKREP